MADGRPQFEQIDQTGQTKHYNGTVGTTAVAVPSSPIPDNVIAEILINTTKTEKDLHVSFDGGTTFMRFKKKTLVSWAPRGNIQQVYIKADESNVSYELIINFEESC